MFDAGLAAIERLGLVPREFPTTRWPAQRLRAEPRARAADFNAAFIDPSIAAVIASIGRARGYSEEQKSALDDAVRTVVVDEFGVDHVVTVTTMDFGHTDPQWILPRGVNAELDPASSTFRLVEPAVG